MSVNKYSKVLISALSVGEICLLIYLHCWEYSQQFTQQLLKMFLTNIVTCHVEKTNIQCVKDSVVQ